MDRGVRRGLGMRRRPEPRRDRRRWVGTRYLMRMMGMGRERRMSQRVMTMIFDL